MYVRVHIVYVCTSLCLGFNAHLVTPDDYTKWDPVVEQIHGERTPTVFTEYCHYSAQALANRINRHKAAAVSLSGRGGGGDAAAAVTMNPFRSPVRNMGDALECNMPAYSNGFIITVF